MEPRSIQETFAMPGFGSSWRQFLVELGQAGINPTLMDDEARALALVRGEKLFEFISNIDGQTWDELDELYRRWLSRTGRLGPQVSGENAMECHLLGVNHYDPFGLQELRTLASQIPCLNKKSTAIGLEYAPQDSGQIKSALPAFREELRDGLPQLTEEILDRLVAIPGYEISFAVEHHPSGIIWLDYGRTTDWRSVLHARARFWISTLKDCSTVSMLDVLSRAVWASAAEEASKLCGASDAWSNSCRQDEFSRDAGWVGAVEKYLESATDVDTVVLVVGASHVLPIEGSVLQLLQRCGYVCNVAYPSNDAFRRKCNITTS